MLYNLDEACQIMQDGVTAPLYQERDELQARLKHTEELLADATLEKENIGDERTQLHYQVTRLQDKLASADTCALSTAA